jgi:hypothetical protein
MGIEQIGATEPVQKGLAVVAIADHAIDRSRRSIGDYSAHLAATAAKFCIFAHP